MSELAALLERLEVAIGAAVRSGDIGTPRSLRLHVGGPADDLPSSAELLGIGDGLFGGARIREAQTEGATLCVWQGGQVATISRAPAPLLVVVLAVLGSSGALHLSEQQP